MYFWWEIPLRFALLFLFLYAVTYGTDALFRRVREGSWLGRLIARERLWCARRGGNWWRGGSVRPEDFGRYAREIPKQIEGNTIVPEPDIGRQDRTVGRLPPSLRR